MRTSFLSRFRGADGRSLARALAFLILINGLVAGLHSGAMAAVPVGSVCSLGADAAGGDADAGHPGGATDRPCCTFGCVPVPAALPGADPNAALPPALREIKARPPHPVILATAEPQASHRPRGPPVLT